MQDRFKFRIYCKSEKKMMLFNNPTLIDGDIFQGGLLFKNYDHKITNCNEINPEDLILMQCTGLKDHTGKLIFEGDIVKLSYNGGQFTLFGDKFSENPEPDYFLVEYSECWQQYFCQKLPLNYPCAIQLEKLHMSFEHDLYPNNADVKARHELNKAILVNDYDKFSEVIGNQYENPELLEREW